VLRTGSDLLTDRQRQRLTAVSATEQHVEVEATWGVYYQRIVAAYRDHDRAGTSNGPTEAINGRLEHLRGSALGIRNITNYIARSLLETADFKPQLHRQSG
jgi:transposase